MASDPPEFTDGWYVPGGPFVTATKRIHLFPPPMWPHFVLEIPRVPPSMNVNEVRSHWSGFQKHKKSWQDEITQLLMVERVRRSGYQRAMAGAFMRFPRRVARRDSGNFAHVLIKACGDALAQYGAIPDDDERRYFFGSVEFDDELGPARTRIVIFLQPEEE